MEGLWAYPREGHLTFWGCQKLPGVFPAEQESVGGGSGETVPSKNTIWKPAVLRAIKCQWQVEFPNRHRGVRGAVSPA